MIFDSKEYKTLSEKYAGIPNHRSPRILMYERDSFYEDEKLLLERLLKQSKSTLAGKHSEWKGKLLSDELNYGNFIGAWYEMMTGDCHLSYLLD